MWDNETIEWIDIELTSFCNIECPGCLRQVKKNTVDHILNKDILKFSNLKRWITLKEFPNLRLLNFCGSVDEPTLHPDILKIVKHFKSICEINIASNGSTKTKKFWKELGSHGVSVFFGLDGIDQKSLKKYRIGSSFKKVQENYRTFIKAGGQATWQFIVFKHNEHLLEEARKISKEEGFKHFRTIYSHREGSEEVKIHINEEEEIFCKYGNQKRLFLNHTGALIPCCYLNSESLDLHANNKATTKFGEKYKELGLVLSNNLKYNTISEVIEGELFKYIVNSWKSSPVEKCLQTCKKKKRDIFIDEEI
jgi:MoaA/NifB/PqqE/SkfB family radical SAM enzyme